MQPDKTPHAGNHFILPAAEQSFIITNNRERFMQAASEPQIRVAILTVAQARLERERKIFRQILTDPDFDAEQSFALYSQAGEEDELSLTSDLTPASETLWELSGLFCDLSGRAECCTEIIPGWRESPSLLDVDDSLHTHDFDVLNRVLFSGGTLFKAGNEIHQSPEGAFTYIKAGTLHGPERETDENAGKPRMTVGTHPLIGLEV